MFPIPFADAFGRIKELTSQALNILKPSRTIDRSAIDHATINDDTVNNVIYGPTSSIPLPTSIYVPSHYRPCFPGSDLNVSSTSLLPPYVAAAAVYPPSPPAYGAGIGLTTIPPRPQRSIAARFRLYFQGEGQASVPIHSRDPERGPFDFRESDRGYRHKHVLLIILFSVLVGGGIALAMTIPRIHG
ncbi:hypothetical protein Hypma_005227 [Hypsizygus marmoreus]|uniref:Uncharacterized protein n=1 Tax=Hypsizygus marmoreus TaxID=39966 RepID=A0A369IZC5_HYPMA|nr:hypothetical protein Hypma_005227 [Hypsizygus marmoreus]